MSFSCHGNTPLHLVFKAAAPHHLFKAGVSGRKRGVEEGPRKKEEEEEEEEEERQRNKDFFFFGWAWLASYSLLDRENDYQRGNASHVSLKWFRAAHDRLRQAPWLPADAERSSFTSPSSPPLPLLPTRSVSSCPTRPHSHLAHPRSSPQVLNLISNLRLMEASHDIVCITCAFVHLCSLFDRLASFMLIPLEKQG
ncbi:hypothetical protein E2C01_087936 [Portunus trituberculatus]|uniref:Uncharacterized protein n=1 Tax=Portunus trituberculatus TaxID=210409 RepID=A0A5B7JFD9_PORTR|nr:hypothetical protein [Portunus trituberculatus]